MLFRLFNEILKGGKIIGLILALVFPATSFAQIDEIIVTAIKREESLQNIPVSVSVTPAEVIEQARIIDLIDLQFTVPSLRITQHQSSANANFLIRGFGNGANNPGVEPSAGVFIDGVYRSRSASSLADLTTIERVELVRGPQSTLFGKNASVGIISITTAKPDPAFGGQAELTIGDNGIALAKGTWTGLLEENISFRVTASLNQADGYYTNLTNDSDVNGRDRYALRGQILIEPNDALTIRLIGDYDSTDEKCCGVSIIRYDNSIAGALSLLNGGAGIADTTNPYSRDMYLTFNPITRREAKGGSAQIDYKFNDMVLTYISSGREQTVYSETDPDFSNVDLVGENIIRDEFNTITQEVRLASDNDAPLQWMVGAYYFDEDVSHFRNVLFGSQFKAYGNLLARGLSQRILGASVDLAGFVAALGPAAALLGGANAADNWFRAGDGVRTEAFSMESEALSLFGQLDYEMTDRVTITLGLNHTDDEKRVASNVVIVDPFSEINFDNLARATNIPALVVLKDYQFFPQFRNYPNADETGIFQSDDLVHTLRLTYERDENINLYVSHATGFKASSVNMSYEAVERRFAGPEDVEVIELGAKMQFDKGFVNFALFEQKTKNFQSNTFNGRGFDLVNAGEQSTKGLEIDGHYQVNDNFAFLFAATLLDPVYDSFKRAPCDRNSNALPEVACDAGTNNQSRDLTGRKPAGIHEVSLNASVMLDYPLAPSLQGLARFEYVYEDEMALVDNIPTSVAQQEVNLLNASFSVIHESRGWEIMLWARNLTDDDYFVSAFPLPAQSNSFAGYVNAPRSFGLIVRQNF